MQFVTCQLDSHVLLHDVKDSPLDMKTMTFTTCVGSTDYDETGHSTNSSKSPVMGSFSFPSTPGISVTGSIRSSPYPLTPYLFHGKPRVTEPGHSECFYINCAIFNFTRLRPGSSVSPAGYSREYSRYASNPSKNNSSTRQVSFSPETYIDAYSNLLDNNKNTPSTLNAISTSYPTSPLSITNHSSFTQYTNENKQNNSNYININCHDGVNEGIILIHDASNEAIISAHNQVNNAIVCDQTDGLGTALPDYINGTDTDMSSSEIVSGSCRNTYGVIGATDRTIMKAKSKYNLKKSSTAMTKNGEFFKVPKSRKRKSSLLLSETPSSHHHSSKPARLTTSSENELTCSLPRPPYSYAALIRLAILSSPEKRLTLQEIYKFILTNFEYYRYSKVEWTNSIRHNLSVNECFIKLEREGGGHKRGGYWLYDSDYEISFQNNNWRRRVRMKRPAKSRKDSKGSSSSNVSTFIPDRQYHHPYTLTACKILPHCYRPVNPNDGNWSLSHMASSMHHSSKSSSSTYSSCQRMQGETIHVGYVQMPLEPIVTSAQTSITLPTAYPAHNYVPPSAAFPGHYPGHYMPESSCSVQQNHRYFSY